MTMKTATVIVCHLLLEKKKIIDEDWQKKI